jgi:Regulator of chromosome condensation (RCC1) repeat
MPRSAVALATLVFVAFTTFVAAPRARPQTVPAAALIRDIAIGGGALVVRADGSVLFWGRDADGQAARPPSRTRVITAPVVLDLPGKAVQAAIGEPTAYALLEDGTVVAWGPNDEGQLGNGPMGAGGELAIYRKPSVTPVPVTGLTDIIQVEAGTKHAVALRKDGTVWAWGTRDEGALGDGTPTTLRPTRAIGPIRVPGVDGITQIAVVRSHNLALRADGHVMSWGSNSDGELGNGTRNAGWTAAEVTGLDHVVAIAAGTGGGKGVSGAVRDDGTVWLWGTNTSAQMGNGAGPMSPDDPGGRNLLPVQVKGVAGAKSLSLGLGHAAALLRDGTLMMWGHDGWGQIGVGTSGFYHERPVKVTGITNVAAVYLGGPHSFAVKTDGSLWIWGFAFVDGQGILGKYLHVPTRLDLPLL